MTNTNNALVPLIPTDDLKTQMQSLFDASIGWFQTHWLQIAIAIVVGAVIVLALHAVRR